MSRTPISLERVDEDDPTLTADGLSEFLPADRSESDQMLAVSSLSDLFPARETDDIGDFFSAGSATSMAGSEASVFDEVTETSLDEDEVDDVFEPGQSFRLDGFFESDDNAVPSDIQKAATEFQRFAEKFHAFAIENQHR